MGYLRSRRWQHRGGDIAARPKQQPIPLYWNSHDLTKAVHNAGMALWDDVDGYYSTSIGPEQTFKLINMGAGRLALQMTAGPTPDNIWRASRAAMYPDDGYGTNSFIAIASNEPPWSFGLTEGEDQLPDPKDYHLRLLP